MAVPLARNESRLLSLAKDLDVPFVETHRPRTIALHLSVVNEDTVAATEALQRHRSDAFNNKKHFLRRKPSTKAYSAAEADATIREALDGNAAASHIKALLSVRESMASRRQGFLRRKTISVQPPGLANALLSAVSRKDYDMLRVLGQKTLLEDHNKALAVAIREKNGDAVSILLGLGADPRTYESELKTSIEADDYDFVMRLLSGKTKFEQITLDSMLSHAVNLAKPSSVAALLFHGADANAENGRALRSAVQHKRIQLLCAICLSSATPTQDSLQRAFQTLAAAPLPSSPAEEILLDLLLASGLAGDSVAQFTIRACESTNHVRLVQMLLWYRADLSYQNSEAILQSTIRSNLDVFKILMIAHFDQAVAAEALLRCSQHFDRMDPVNRIFFAEQLLKRGARTNPLALGSALLSSVQIGDNALATLLVNNGAAADHADGAALCYTVTHMLEELLRILLTCRPTERSVNRAFSKIRHLPAQCRLSFTQTLLSAGASGEEVNRLLWSLFVPQLESKDHALMEVLVGAGADCNGGECLASSVRTGDLKAVNVLCGGTVSVNVASSCVAIAQALQDRSVRLKVMAGLLTAGASGAPVGDALIDAAREAPPDLGLLDLLLGPGKADVNHRKGQAIQYSVQGGETTTLVLLLQGEVSQDVLDTMLHTSTQIPDATKRLEITRQLLERGAGGQDLDRALVHTVMEHSNDRQLISLLLKHGASVDYNSGQAIKSSVDSANLPLLALLLEKKSRTTTLAGALQQAMTMLVPPDRYEGVRMILETAKGSISHTCSEVLPSCMEQSQDHTLLLEILLAHGASVNYNDGEALHLATMTANLHHLGLMLQHKPNARTFQRAFNTALRTSRDVRRDLCERLIVANADQKSLDLSKALIFAVEERTPSLVLIELLLTHGASVYHSNNRSLEQAIERKQPDILRLLLPAVGKRTVIVQLFTSFSHRQALWDSAAGLECLRLLLEHGATGEAVNAALLNAVHQFERHEFIGPFVDTLIKYDADVAWKNGSCIIDACRQGNLKLVLRLLQGNPTAELCSTSFPLFLNSKNASAEDTSAFLDALQSRFGKRSEQSLVFHGKHHDLGPILFLCIERWPDNTTLLRKLLRHGCLIEEPQDQFIKIKSLSKGTKADTLTVLLAAVLNVAINYRIIKCLVDAGANIDYRSPQTGTTPLLAAVGAMRHDVARLLVERGASSKIRNSARMTTLFAASQLDSFEMLSILLQAERSHYPVNDGSLHEAARYCNSKAVRLLLNKGHDYDHPSNLHEGRTALQELALKCTIQEDDSIQVVVKLLLQHETDAPFSNYMGKPLLLLALDNQRSSIAVTHALYNAGLHRTINHANNLYRTNGYVFSPLSYLEKGLQQSPPEDSAGLQQILRNCHKVYYRESGGEQPADMEIATAPVDIRDEFNTQRRRNILLAQQEEDHRLSLQRGEELFRIQESHRNRAAGQEQKLLQQTHELSLAQGKEKADQQLAINKKANLQQERFAEHQRDAEYQHQSRINQERLSTTAEDNRLQIENRRQLALQDQATTDAKMNAQRKLLEMERKNRNELEASTERRLRIEYGYAERNQRLEMEVVREKKAGVRQQERLVEAQKELARTAQQVQKTIEYNMDYYSPD